MPAGTASAHVWQRLQGCAYDCTHASQMVRAGQAAQIAHWPGIALCKADTRAAALRNIGSIYSWTPRRPPFGAVSTVSMSAAERPPTIDPIAADRWRKQALSVTSPWLHEEIGRRMEERLQWITRQPRRWTDWYPLRGGLAAHALVSRRFAGIACDMVESTAVNGRTVAAALAKPWWKPLQWNAGAQRVYAEPEDPPEAGSGMVWSNMALHFHADPQTLMRRWHRALQSDGYLMFSCLGPDTLKELRTAYTVAGLPAPGAAFTDMHDWGDMLLQAGFAEPIMDMERIVLRYERPERLIEELRETGRNLHPDRFAGLRGRRFGTELRQLLSTQLAASDGSGPLAVTVEVIYGHAFKAPARAGVAAETAVSLADMRQLLRRDR